MESSRLKAFNYGQLSAIVEPIAAVIGAAAVLIDERDLPYALAFAAEPMIFVVVEELIRSRKRTETAILQRWDLWSDLRSMILDVALG